MNNKIYINGQRLDLPENTNITLTFRSAAFVSIDKLNNSYSNTISVPRTARNESILGGVIFPSSSSETPYTYLAASIELDGVMVVPSAVAYITEVTTDEVKLTVMWDSVTKLAAMVADGRKLNELPISPKTKVILWNKESAKAYPKWDMGLGRGAEDEFTAMHPSAKVTDIIDEICTTYELPPLPEGDKNVFSTWRIPMLNRIDPMITDGDELTENNVTSWYGTACVWVRGSSYIKDGEKYTTKYPLWLGRVGKANGSKPGTELPETNFPPIKPQYPPYELPNFSITLPTAEGDIIEDITNTEPIPDTEHPLPNGGDTPPDYVSRELRGIVFHDNSHMYSDMFLKYLVPFKPNLKFKMSGNLVLPIADSNKASEEFILANVKLKLVLMFGLIGSTSLDNEEVLATFDAYKVSPSGVHFVFDSAESNAMPYPLLGETDVYNNLICRIELRCEYEDTIADRFILKQERTGSLDKDIPALYIGAYQDVLRLGSNWYTIPNLPPIKVIDFLKALGQMSGRFLTIDSHFNGFKRVSRMRYRSYKEYEEKKAQAYDWSKYMVRALGSVTDMSFRVGDWAQRNIFQYKEGERAKDSVDFFIQNKSLKAEYKAVELPFMASAHRDSNQSLYVPLYKYKESAVSEEGSTSEEGSSSEEGSTSAEFEDAGDDAYIGEYSNGYLTNTLKWNKLIKNYATLFEALKQAKVIREAMRLPYTVLQDIDLYTPVYLRQYGAYFAIIEIRTRQNGVADVELLKI